MNKRNTKKFLQQASRVERSHPKSESVLSQSNKDDEKFKHTEQESLSPVAEEDRHASKGDSHINVDPSNQRVTPSVTPTYNLDSSNFGQEAGTRPDQRYQEKMPAKGRVQAIHMDATTLSPKASQEVRSLAKGQGSKTSLLSKNSKKKTIAKAKT